MVPGLIHICSSDHNFSMNIKEKHLLQCSFCFWLNLSICSSSSLQVGNNNLEKSHLCSTLLINSTNVPLVESVLKLLIHVVLKLCFRLMIFVLRTIVASTRKNPVSQINYTDSDLLSQIITRMDESSAISINII